MSDKRKTALITGSGRNIGRAMAHDLAKDGFNIIVNGSSSREPCDRVADEVRALGVDAEVMMCNVGDKSELTAMGEAALKRFGSVDVIVNNVAIRPISPFLEIDEDEWNRVFDINLNAPARLARMFLPGMIDAGWGRIVNFTGMNAMRGHANRPHVSTSKHAVLGLTRSLAVEFGQYGITINCISPGPIKSERDDPEFEAYIAKTIGSNPTRRQGTAAEVSAAVRMLVSDGGAYINGQMIQVNGGAAL
ncbi:SDR family oxidoreductase [Alphaproteobacteria bacterium HT1-32]|jgi:3-oxoacyl-[acyl-carrier protein] reductase|nr:SDR family oxidoreductase [Alphaproteobacteria bacterium HT1-32]